MKLILDNPSVKIIFKSIENKKHLFEKTLFQDNNKNNETTILWFRMLPTRLMTSETGMITWCLDGWLW